MPSLIDALTGADNKMSSEIIANDMIMGAKAIAMGYLMAALESATPEVKSLFFNNVTMITQSHQALTEMALKKGWYKPYQTPAEQLKEAFSYSQNFTRPNA